MTLQTATPKTKTKQRATPENPTIGITQDTTVARDAGRNLPPNLGPDAIAILEGRTFMFSDASGDIPEGSIGGLVHADTRILNKWELTINGQKLLPLQSGVVDYYSDAFYLTNAKMDEIPPNTLAIRRRRFVGSGMREHIELENFGKNPLTFELCLAIGNDFADLFEIKSQVRDRSKQIERNHAPDNSQIQFIYNNETFSKTTMVHATQKATRIENDTFIWEITLPPDGMWECELYVPITLGPREIQPTHKNFSEAFKPTGNDPVSLWLEDAPQPKCDSSLLNEVLTKTVHDILALRLQLRLGGTDVLLPAAGLPWFLTLFGRDTLITAYQTVPFGPGLAKGAIIALASLQGTEKNDFKDEEPGKILHEFRAGELTQLGIKPHNPYYGAADSTQLWLILLSEYWRWTKDDDFVKSLKQNVLTALSWIDDYGDRDGDGYVEYQTRSPQGLGNQCWRDSWEGIQYSNGTIPYLPLATCETQGYTYDAKLRTAELFDGPLNDPKLATELRKDAEELKKRFNEDYWIDSKKGYYAIALDGDKKKVDSLTSNNGHLLWSGIIPKDRAKIIAKHLMSDALYSGWGVRTLSTNDKGFNPIGYHLGTVWPHDNSIIAAGLARYGFRDEANKIIMSLLHAAAFSDNRLPEALSGYSRGFGSFPIPYPTACSPQAWATGAPLLFLRTMLGFDSQNGKLTLDPDIPSELGRILITRSNAMGKKWDIEANGKQGDVRLSTV